MKILYLTILLLISNLFFSELVNSEESREIQNEEIEIGLIKKNNISTRDIILENVPKLKLDIIKTKVSSDIDIFSYKNIELYKTKINLYDFQLVGLMEIEGIKSILISSSDEIKSFKEGEILDNKYQIKEISIKSEYVVLQKDKDLQIIYLDK
tara:strand:+ start:481 stop:939 length:459 start_codon:yes stop_codon:yes gene_type:complete